MEAHEWAAEQAIAYMERDSARVVRGHKASKADIAAGIEDTLTTHRAVGFVGIRYRHRVNRLQDPHLHTHYVIGNWAEGPDGRFTALAAEHIYEHAKAGGAVYQLALRSKLRELERWIEWGQVENGLADVSEELVPAELREEMSGGAPRSSKSRPSSWPRGCTPAARCATRRGARPATPRT